MSLSRDGSLDMGHELLSASGISPDTLVPEPAPAHDAQAPGPAGQDAGPSDDNLSLQPGERLYFAYGANMNPAVLTKRKVSPRLSLPCQVPGHYLSFRQIGLPYMEPGFASLLPRRGAAHSPRSAALAPDSIYSPSARHDGQKGEEQGPDVHGVLHILSSEDWSVILRFEAVGSTATGYQVVVVNCVTYGGRTIPAFTLQSHPNSLHSPSTAAAPSLRYISMLREGAQHFGCKPAFVDYLGSLPHYAVVGKAAQAGKLAVSGLMLTAALPVLPLLATLRFVAKRPMALAALDEFGVTSGKRLLLYQMFSRYLSAAFSVAWAVHDHLLAPLLGSGASVAKR